MCFFKLFFTAAEIIVSNQVRYLIAISFAEKYRISPGCIYIIILTIALNNIPCMVCDTSIWICSLSGYIDTGNTQLLQQILAAFCIAGTNRSFSDKSTVNVLVIRCIKIIIYVIYEIGVNVFDLFIFI